MALFSSQTIELIELLAIHAVCSLDSKDTMNSRGRERLSRGLRVTVRPASRTRPPFPEWRAVGVRQRNLLSCPSACFGVVPSELSRSYSPGGQQDSQCWEDDCSEAVSAYF